MARLTFTATVSQRAPGSLTHDPLRAVPSTEHVDTRRAALSVTVRAVIDPLRGSGAALQPGTRAVGVIVQIANGGPATYDSSATGDVTVVTSSGSVSPVLAKRGICRTHLEDFDRYVTAGEDRVGCVAFAVAVGSTLTEVWFSPHAQAVGRLVWAA